MNYLLKTKVHINNDSITSLQINNDSITSAH